MKISTKPRVERGLSTLETNELVIDFETTGIDHETLRIVEVGLIGVDRHYGDTFYIESMIEHGDIQENIDTIMSIPALVEMHTENGIVDDLERMLSGDCVGMTPAVLEQTILDFLPDGTQIILGGSGANFEYEILRRHLPNLFARMSPFIDDAGPQRRGYRNAVGHNLTDFTKDKTHRGFGDARAHLAELRAFRDYHKRVEKLLRVS